MVECVKRSGGVEWSGVEWSGVEWSGVEWSARNQLGHGVQHTPSYQIHA
jgi:hypothetical protein